MTQLEINNYLDIPFTTLSDWKKENSNRSKLYELLLNLDTNLVHNILDKKNNHRFFHILNRNTNNDNFEYSDIKKAFNNKDYHLASIKEQVIYSKFFKEIDVEELDDFTKTFNVSKRDIKAIYISSPFRNIEGIAKKWNKRFRLPALKINTNSSNKMPTALQNILNKKNLTNV